MSTIQLQAPDNLEWVKGFRPNVGVTCVWLVGPPPDLHPRCTVCLNHLEEDYASATVTEKMMVNWGFLPTMKWEDFDLVFCIPCTKGCEETTTKELFESTHFYKGFQKIIKEIN